MTDPSVELLRSVGLDRITEDTGLPFIEAMLRELVGQLNGADPLRLATIRQMVVDRLRDAKVAAAAKLVDAAFAVVLKQEYTDNLQGQAVRFADLEPWPEPVDGSDLLAELEQFITRFMVVPAATPAMLAALVVHTYAADLRDTATYLAVLSPTPECGKSRLLEVLNVLVSRAWLTTVPSTAVLFRVLEGQQPTLLLDEAEVVKGHGDAAADVRALLHSGYRRGATVPRCVGDDFEVRQFRVFGPKVFAVIGDLPSALLTRCVCVQMKRRKREEKIARFLQRKVQAEATRLQRQVRRWVVDNATELRDVEPVLPEFLSDRQQETWEPLLAVGQVAGEDCYKALVDSAKKLNAEGGAVDDSNSLLLLSDSRDIFERRGSEQVSTADMLEELNKLSDHPWATHSRGKPITAYGVSKLLKPFEISPKPLWIEGKTTQGYERKSFEDVWTRYFPGVSPQGPQGSSEDGEKPANQTPQGELGLGELQIPVPPRPDGTLGDLGELDPENTSVTHSDPGDAREPEDAAPGATEFDSTTLDPDDPEAAAP